MPEVEEIKQVSEREVSWSEYTKRVDYKDIVERATSIISLLNETYTPELRIGIVRANLNPEKLSLMFLLANKNKDNLVSICRFSDTARLVEKRVLDKEGAYLEVFHVDFWKIVIDYQSIKNDFPHLVYINNRIGSNTPEPVMV